MIMEQIHLLPPDLVGYVFIGSAALAALCIMNWATLLVGRFRRVDAYHILRSGYLTTGFYVVCALHIVIVCLPLVFVTFHFTLVLHCTVWWTLVFTGCLLIHFCFWALCLYRLVKNRHFHEQPLTLVASYAAELFVLIFPLASWSTIFPHRFEDPYVFYHLAEVLFALIIFGALASGATLKQTRYSPWDNFFGKFATIWPYMWPSKSVILRCYVWLCVALLVAGRVINVAVPLYNKWIVDELSRPEPSFCYQLIITATLLKFLQGGGAMGGFLNTVRTFLWIRVQQYTTLEIEVDMLKHLHNLSLRFHLSRRTGEVLRVMDRGTSSINTLLSYILFNVVPTIADIVLASIFFFVQFNAFFGILVCATMIIYLTSTIVLTEWRSKYRIEMNSLENQTSSAAVDSLLNYETVKYYNAEMLEVDRYTAGYKKFQAAEYKSNASLALLNVIQNVVIGLGLIGGSLLAAYWIVSAREMTVGDYVLFTTYILQLYGPLNFFGTIYRVVQRAFIDMENMLELFREETEICDDPDAIELENVAGSIEFRNVSFAYKLEKLVLRNLSFTVNPGETVAIVGPSGSGKTTLIRLLFRLYDVTDGELLLNGYNVRQLTLSSLRSRIGIVPQDTVLFNETIRFNIRYGRPSASDEEVEQASKAASIHDFIRSHPDGYDCLVGERGLKLSGGEKQRVAIARTILKNPEYILLDEATSALDSKTERTIRHYLSKLCKQRTCIIVAHRLSTIMHANKIFVMNAGQIVESGTHDELLAQKGVYAEMWSLQHRSAEIQPSPD